MTFQFFITLVVMMIGWTILRRTVFPYFQREYRKRTGPGSPPPIRVTPDDEYLAEEPYTLIYENGVEISIERMTQTCTAVYVHLNNRVDSVYQTVEITGTFNIDLGIDGKPVGLEIIADNWPDMREDSSGESTP